MGRATNIYGRIRQDADVIQSSLIDFTATWCETVFGAGALATALEGFCQSTGAEAGMIVRGNIADGTALRIATHDVRRKVPGVPPLVESFAGDHFGTLFDAARPGTLWLGSSISEASLDLDAPLPEWQHKRGMRELAVIVLTSGTGTRDHIELHFRDRLTQQEYSTLAILAPTLGRTWAMRQTGLVSQTLAAARGPRRQASARRARSGHPLSASNPAQLSRTEFRVCLLLSQGLPVSRVAEEMSLALATVRSHLRSIYAKTEANGLADLVYLLLSKPGSDGSSQACA